MTLENSVSSCGLSSWEPQSTTRISIDARSLERFESGQAAAQGRGAVVGKNQSRDLWRGRFFHCLRAAAPVPSTIGAVFLASTFRLAATGMIQIGGSGLIGLTIRQSAASRVTLVGGVFSGIENGTGSLPVGNQ